MKATKPNLQIKTLYYSQLDSKPTEFNNSFGNSPHTKSKPIPKREEIAS